MTFTSKISLRSEYRLILLNLLMVGLHIESWQSLVSRIDDNIVSIFYYSSLSYCLQNTDLHLI